MRLVHRSTWILAALLAAGCSSNVEQQVLQKYFDASKLRDQTTLANIAAVSFDRDAEGIVERFRVVSLSSEERQTLKIREYAKAYQEAKAADDAFTKQIRAYQDENKESIDRVVRAEAKKAKVSGRDAVVQAAWQKWRQDLAEHAKRLSESRQMLGAERRIAELSTYDARRPIDIDDYDGELVTKHVTIDATIRKDDQVATRQLLITMQRAQLKGPEGERDGRWIVTSIKPV